ncbi:MAG: Rieske 2Fe-2S domain-containing protein [Nitrososphaerales archaeon]
MKKVVAKTSEIREGEIKAFKVDGKQIILVKNGGKIYALSRFCTHEEADLSTGFLLEDRLVCPLHLSQFDLKSGAALTPPATEPLASYVVEVVEDMVVLDF